MRLKKTEKEEKEESEWAAEVEEEKNNQRHPLIMSTAVYFVWFFFTNFVALPLTNSRKKF